MSPMSPMSSGNPASPDRPVGVLALQGDFPTHRVALERAGLRVREVRDAAGLDGLAGLVLPGGESTTMLKLLDREALREPLAGAVRAGLASGLPILATCAGVVLLARSVRGPEQPSLGLLALDVERNAYGRQVASGVFALTGENGFPDAPGTFIRAPRIRRVDDGLIVLARRGDDPVLVQQGSCLAATFHPELDRDHPAYRRFVEAVVERAPGSTSGSTGRSPKGARREPTSGPPPVIV